MADPVTLARERRRQKQAADGEQAMREYRAREEAARNNTVRLRKLRLAAQKRLRPQPENSGGPAQQN
jgi:hypothetical protein